MEQLADDLYTVETDQRLLGGFVLPLRMTVARMSDGRLWLHNPIPIDEALAGELAELGDVAHIIAPNKFHHMHFAPACERYPDARRYLPPGLGAKQKKLGFDVELSDTTQWDEIEQLVLEGAPAMNEVVFHHRASRTLIVGDLVFNVPELANFRTKIMCWMNGTLGRVSCSRLWDMVIRDKRAFADSIDRVAAWEPERVLMGHGETLDGPDVARFDGAVARLQQKAPARRLPPPSEASVV